VATQLSAKKLRGLMEAGIPPVRLPLPVLLGTVVFCIVLTYAWALLTAANAQQDESAARRRFVDAQTLLALPPASTDDLEGTLEAARAGLAAAQERQASSPEEISDETVAALVSGGEASGLAVRSIERIPPGQVRLGDADYAVDAIRFAVEGTESQLLAFLNNVESGEAPLIATLNTLSQGQGGSVGAELIFSAFRKVEPAEAEPAPTAGARP
jgi:hypothetical protein